MINLQDYIHDSRLFKTFKVDDLLFVEYRCLVADPHADIWTHHNYLAYVLGGQKKWKTPSCEYCIKSGEALFIRKGVHTVYQYFDEPFIVLFIFIPDDFIRQVVSRYVHLLTPTGHTLTPDEHLIPLRVNPVLESFFQSLLAYFSQDAAQPKEMLKLKLEELVLNILTQPGNQPLKQYVVTLGQRRYPDLEEVMQANYFRPLSIGDYARLCSRSLASFRRDFEQRMGTPPGKWLMAKRLEYSRFLLETTDMPLTEVIDQAGFKNRSHFTRAFKHAYQVSPGRYRLQIEA